MTIIEEPVTTALHLQPPDFDSKTQRVYLEFQGVNSSAEDGVKRSEGDES